jgi:hypothetical protein
MLKNQEIIKLIQTKEEAIKQQMGLLLGLYKLNDMRNYRNFNNVFIASVKTIVEILRTNRIHKTGILNDDKYDVVINGVEESKENVIKLTEINEDIKNFILDMINKLTEKSKYIEVHFFNSEIEDNESIRYKYSQQIVDDYIKLLMLIER